MLKPRRQRLLNCWSCQRRSPTILIRSVWRNLWERAKVKQVKEESETSEESSEKDELPLISRRFNHLWKHRQGRSSNKGSSNCKKVDANLLLVRRKEKKAKKFYKKKGFMATWDNSESEEDSEERTRSHYTYGQNVNLIRRLSYHQKKSQ